MGIGFFKSLLVVVHTPLTRPNLDMGLVLYHYTTEDHIQQEASAFF
jgi:hypothetical protein